MNSVWNVTLTILAAQVECSMDQVAKDIRELGVVHCRHNLRIEANIGTECGRTDKIVSCGIYAILVQRL
jgi:hypothetical protein